MLAIADDIFKEVETEVLLLNGEVVRRALRVDYPAEIEKIRNEFYEAVREAHRARDNVLAALDPSEKDDSIPVWRIRQNKYAYSEQCGQLVNELRDKLFNMQNYMEK